MNEMTDRDLLIRIDERQKFTKDKILDVGRKVDQLASKVDDQNGRIGKTENTVSKIIGVGITITVLATAVGAWAAGLF